MSSRVAGLAGLLLLAFACAAPPEPPPVPSPDLSGMEPRVRLAILEAQKRVEQEPGSAAAWGGLGQVLDAHELDPEAEAAYRQARELAPEDPRWPYLLGRLLGFKGTAPEEVAALFEESVRLDPSYAPAHLRLGDARLALGDAEGAAAAYRRALSLDPSLAKAQLGLGRALLASERVADAVAALEAARELDPADQAVYAELSRALLRAGERQRAEQMAERAGRTEPTEGFPDPRLEELAERAVSSGAVFERALGRLEAGDAQGAAADLLSIAALREGDPYFHRALGRAYLELDRPEPARERLERAVELSPELTDARVWLGTLLVAAGEPAAGRRHLERALGELAGGDADRALEQQARAQLGRALAAEGRLTEAVAELERAAGLGPLDPGAELAWGNVLAQQGRLTDALEHFERAVASEPRSAEARFHVGLALEGLGRRTEAVEQYRRSMELEPNPLAAARLRALGAAPPRTP